MKKTITVTLTENEYAFLVAITADLDPSGKISPTSVLAGAAQVGLMRVAARRSVPLPKAWGTWQKPTAAEHMSYSLGAIERPSLLKV